MAQIILSGDEFVCILSANGLVPDEVMDIEIAGQEIKVRVRTPWPILKSIRVGMRFAGFERGQAVLQLMTNRLIDKFDWLVDKMLAGFPLADHGARWEYPRLYVDVNGLLEQQVRGVQITNIALEDGRFHVTTLHTAGSNASRSDGAEREENPPPAASREDTQTPRG